MIKTEQQIERDFYSFIKESSLGKAIKGSIYRPDMRPADAKTEDLVVKFYTGIDEQIQSGTVIIDIYIPDVKNTDGRMVRNFGRIGVLQDEILSFVNNNDDTEYLMETETTPYSVEVEGIDQHCVKARIKFQRLSSNE